MLVALGVLLFRITLWGAILITAFDDHFWWALALVEISLLADFLVPKLLARHSILPKWFSRRLAMLMLPSSSTTSTAFCLWFGLLDELGTVLLIVIGGAMILYLINSAALVSNISRMKPLLDARGLAILMLTVLTLMCVWSSGVHGAIMVVLTLVVIVQSIYVALRLPSYAA